MSTKVLREEAKSDNILSTGGRNTLLENILEHLKRNSPLVNLTIKAAAVEQETQSEPEVSTEDSTENTNVAVVLNQLLTTMSAFMQQQQTLFQHFQMGLNINNYEIEAINNNYATEEITHPMGSIAGIAPASGS